jgi:hypothetical protein
MMKTAANPGGLTKEVFDGLQAQLAANLGHRRRQLLGIAVTQHPTADWLARQITEAFPWATAPKYLIRDNDRAFGGVFKARVRALGDPGPADLVPLTLAERTC